MDRRVAKRYARAIFQAAIKAELVKATEDDLKGIVSLIYSNESFMDFLLSPKARREDKLAMLDRVLKGQVSQFTLNVVHFLIDKRRETELPLIAEEFEVLRRDFEKVVYVKVTSIEELTKTQQQAIIDKLAKRLGKTIEPEFDLDPTLIGGIRVAYENIVLDGSVRGGLARLESLLHYDLLKQA